MNDLTLPDALTVVAGSRRSPGAHTEIVSTLQDFVALRREWDELFDRAAGPQQVFQSFEFVETWGRHYLGATVSFSSILGSDVGVSLFALVNMSDWSGIVTPAVSYSFLDRFSISASLRFTFGGEDDEYTDPAAVFTGETATPTVGLTISLSTPGGSF